MRLESSFAVLVVELSLAHWVWLQSQARPLAQAMAQLLAQVLTQLVAQVPDLVQVLKQQQAPAQV